MRLKSLGLVALLSLGIAACGDSDEDSGSNAAPAQTESTASEQPTGEPIKIMSISVRSSQIISLPQVFSGAQAAASVINDAGGINGRPLKVIECSSDFDPNKEAACLKQAVKEEVTAVSGSYVFFPGQIKILEPAGIPFFGGTGTTADEAVSEISYPHPGQSSEDYGVAAQIAALGAKHPVSLHNELPPSVEANKKVSEGLQLAGLPALDAVVTKSAQPDYAAAAAEAMDKNPDAITIFEALNDTAKVINELKQAGYEGPIVQVAGTITPDVLKAVGARAEDIKIASFVMPTTAADTVPEVKQFLDDMSNFEPDAQVDAFSEYSYGMTKVFAEIAKTVDGEVDAKSFTAALDATTTPVETGVIAGFLGSGDPPLPDYPRQLTYGVVDAVIENGEVVAAEPTFYDPVEKLQGLK